MLKVADLQLFVNGFTQPLRNAGASQKVLDDLAGVERTLEPFKTQTLSEFAAFLTMADNYVRTGTLPTSAKPASRSRGGAKAPKLSVETAAQRIVALYERSTDPNLDYATIESEVQALKPLTLKQLGEVAEQVHISLPKGTKEKMLKAIAAAIMDRKSASERTSFRQATSEAHHRPDAASITDASAANV